MENCFFIAAKVKDIQQNVKKCFSICKHLQKDNVDGAIQAVLLPFCDPFCLFIKKKDQKGRSKVTSYFFQYQGLRLDCAIGDSRAMCCFLSLALAGA